MLFGGYTPPDVPGRLVTTDEESVRLSRRREETMKYGTVASRRKTKEAEVNAERIRQYLIANPWSTAKDISAALSLSKTPVYNHLVRLRENKQLEVNKKYNRSYVIISYKWAGK